MHPDMLHSENRVRERNKKIEVNVYKGIDNDPVLSTITRQISIEKKDGYTKMVICFVGAVGGVFNIDYQEIDHVSLLTNQVDIYLKG